LLSRPSSRTAVFIDGPNLFAATKKLGFDIDFKRLLRLFQDGSQLVRACYYTAVSTSPDFQSIRPLIDWLEYNGFTLVTKATKEFSDDTGTRKIKGNMRVELAVDAMQLAPYVDHVVLLSGDGEFNYLVTALKGMGKRVSVISTLQTDKPMLADELRRQANVFVDLVDLQTKIGRHAR
jgi:uncharacterized LabA/DUF88 family protein